jgi:hypothetical protein
MNNLGTPEGLGVLLSPQFMNASALRDMVSASSVVGWFGLVLGCGFLVQYWRRRQTQ